MEKNEEKKCRKCKTGVLNTRAKRAFIVKYFLFWLPIKRYQCNMCGKKIYKFGSYARRRKKVQWV